MTKRRSRGDGGLHWDEGRQRWIASVTTGYTPAGKRIVRKASGKTKTAAKEKLKELVRDNEDGLPIASSDYTVANAVQDWLASGLKGRAATTVEKVGLLATKHIIDRIGARKLRDLTADDVDAWLTERAAHVATQTLRELRSILRRSINRAQARDKVKRNVVLLCDDLPTGKNGRQSKSLTVDQAKAILAASQSRPYWHCYIVLSILTGARTEELRNLRWDHVDLMGDVEADIPPHIKVWRSVREKGDTKTEKSRRSLALPKLCIEALEAHRQRQNETRRKAGRQWVDNNLVFCSRFGTPLDAANVRRGFRTVVKAAGLPPKDWTPRELRHSFVSILSSGGVSIEKISRLVGHSGTNVTEKVYRHQINPVIDHNTSTMNELFPITGT